MGQKNSPRAGFVRIDFEREQEHTGIGWKGGHRWGLHGWMASHVWAWLSLLLLPWLRRIGIRASLLASDLDQLIQTFLSHGNLRLLDGNTFRHGS